MSHNTKNYTEQGGSSTVIGGEIHFDGTIYGLTPGVVYYVDPANGDDDDDGLSMENALKTVAAAYAKCTDGANDVVAMIGGATADYPTEAIVWAKNYTHLIGLSADLPGMGQRCRIVNHADNDLAVLFTLSGSGCIVKNIQFFDGKDKAEAGACVLVSGSRNHFKNVFFAGMGSAEAGAAFHLTGSYSLTVSGSENYFEDCTVGLDTVVRDVANHELIVSGARNRFKHCDIRSNSVTAGKFLVKIDASTDLRDIIFDDCLFFNYSENWATGITDAFNVSGGNTHFIILRGNCQFVGVGLGVANTVTHVYGAGAAPNAGMFISTQPTT